MKKIGAVLTAIMLVMIMGISTITASAKTEEARWYVGDVNRDWHVNAVDASMILRHYALISTGLPSKIWELAADVNHDGFINAVDASTVLSYYAATATGKEVNYEIIVEEKEYDPKDFGKNDLVKFSGTSWYVHSVMDVSNDNLVPNKEFLVNSEVFAIANKYENNWYGIYLDNSKTEVYICISPASLEYFSKVGRLELLNPIATETIPAVVTTTTTTTTSITSTTTSSTSVQTETSTTTTIVTSISCTSATSPATATYTNWQCVQYNGEWGNVRASASITEDNVIGHLENKDIFYIKKHVSGYWYEICDKNADESGKYIKIDPDSEYLFTHVKVLSNYYFIGESWNIRTSKDLTSNSNIVGQLKFGDIVSVVEFYEDGWAKIICNNVDGVNEMYVVLQPFVRLS